MLDINISTLPSTTNNNNNNNIKREAQAWGERWEHLSKCGLRWEPQPKKKKKSKSDLLMSSELLH